KLHSSHVALYLALFQYWNLNRFNSPITIFREEVMRFAKIGIAPDKVPHEKNGACHLHIS
ncbi:MAG: hypothetical protein AAFN93_24640, partial [Bacteroidota bacterium]